MPARARTCQKASRSAHLDPCPDAMDGGSAEASRCPHVLETASRFGSVYSCSLAGRAILNPCGSGPAGQWWESTSLLSHPIYAAIGSYVSKQLDRIPTRSAPKPVFRRCLSQMPPTLSMTHAAVQTPRSLATRSPVGSWYHPDGRQTKSTKTKRALSYDVRLSFVCLSFVKRRRYE